MHRLVVFALLSKLVLSLIIQDIRKFPRFKWKKYNNYKLLESSKSVDLEMVKFLIEKEQVAMSFTDKYGYTLLHLAAQEGQYEVARYLVLSGANIHAEVGGNDTAAIFLFAVDYRHIEIASFLIEKGSKVNVVLDKNNPFG